MRADSGHDSFPVNAALFEQPFDEPLSDDAFNQHALRIFAFQFEHNAPYAAYCVRRERTPAAVAHWTQIPAVPTAAFKEVALVAGNAERAEAVFRTSGTTRGFEKRGVHYVLDTSLYHASLIAAFDACVLADGARPRMLSLVPRAADVPDSSLSHMIDVAINERGAAGSQSFADVEKGIDHERFAAALDQAASDDVVTCILGTSFALVHLLDSFAHRVALAEGSRLMDTGGYKGRSREVGADEMRAGYAAMFGIAASHCINEYGMTEMCSQFYDSTLRDVVHGRVRERCKIAPPWVRTRAVHPETLEPVADGDVGILQHFDLANVASVLAIQTEDLGVMDGSTFQLLGRASGAPPRGCSIAMDMLLEAVAERRT
jgi:hypothetical protein